MKVGIVGAGIAGLSTATAFARQGADVMVYERPGVQASGAGLSLFANGLRALDAIGLGDAVRALGDPPDVPNGLRTPDGTWLVRDSPGVSASYRVVSRRDLQEILATGAPAVRATAVRRVRGTQDDATILCDSGETQTFDIVVGADGIASEIRRSWPDDPGIGYSGYTAWRGVTADPIDLPAAGETWGRGERFGVLPMAGGRVYWFATASVPAGWRVPDEKSELVRRFGSWHDPIPALLNATDSQDILRNDITDLARPLPRFARGRVVLVGDAAHAMTPNLGQGGNQALEDAVTLTALLARGSDLDSALDRYDQMRKRRTAMIARRSRQIGRIAQAHRRTNVALRNALIRLVPQGVAARSALPIVDWVPPQDATGSAAGAPD